LDFEREFEKAPIEDRKSLIKKCISRIIVDREEGLARFYVRRIPAATPELQRLFPPTEDHHGVVTSVSARNPARQRRDFVRVATATLTQQDRICVAMTGTNRIPHRNRAGLRPDERRIGPQLEIRVNQ
jgi:hypothetical protein